MFFGMANRMAKDLDLQSGKPIHIEELSGLPTRLHVELCRRTWWLCYLGDVHSSAATGRSMCINELDSKPPLPHSEAIWNSDLT
jgi:hypothetical protein